MGRNKLARKNSIPGPAGGLEMCFVPVNVTIGFSEPIEPGQWHVDRLASRRHGAPWAMSGRKAFFIHRETNDA